MKKIKKNDVVRFYLSSTLRKEKAFGVVSAVDEDYNEVIVSYRGGRYLRRKEDLEFARRFKEGEWVKFFMGEREAFGHIKQIGSNGAAIIKTQKFGETTRFLNELGVFAAEETEQGPVDLKNENEKKEEKMEPKFKVGDIVRYGEISRLVPGEVIQFFPNSRDDGFSYTVKYYWPRGEYSTVKVSEGALSRVVMYKFKLGDKVIATGFDDKPVGKIQSLIKHGEGLNEPVYAVRFFGEGILKDAWTEKHIKEVDLKAFEEPEVKKESGISEEDVRQANGYQELKDSEYKFKDGDLVWINIYGGMGTVKKHPGIVIAKVKARKPKYRIQFLNPDLTPHHIGDEIEDDLELRVEVKSTEEQGIRDGEHENQHGKQEREMRGHKYKVGENVLVKRTEKHTAIPCIVENQIPSANPFSEKGPVYLVRAHGAFSNFRVTEDQMTDYLPKKEKEEKSESMFDGVKHLFDGFQSNIKDEQTMKVVEDAMGFITEALNVWGGKKK